MFDPLISGSNKKGHIYLNKPAGLLKCVWPFCNKKGHTYLNKPADLFKCVWPFCYHQVLKG